MKNDVYKILVTGGDGQLATCIKDKVNRYISKFEFIFKNKNELDITNESELNYVLDMHKPSIIINCAAYTNVERAESGEENIAFAINTDACRYLANWCLKNKSLLIHVSTDYVFDGRMNIPYKEDDPRVPKNIYGKSKSYGEDEIIKSGCNHIIIRTSWLYSKYGNNFFKKMISKILTSNNNEVFGAIDEIGSPTNATNLANAIVNICNEYTESDEKEQLNGVYHYTDDGIASRYDFLSTMHEYVKKEFICNSVVKPCYSSIFKTKAKRPKYSVMDNFKIKNTFNSVTTSPWRESLKDEIKTVFNGF